MTDSDKRVRLQGTALETAARGGPVVPLAVLGDAGEIGVQEDINDGATVPVDQGVAVPVELNVLQPSAADEVVVVLQRDAGFVGHGADRSGPQPPVAPRGEPRTKLLPAALAAVERGWPVFVLGRTKRPVANCPACPPARDDSAHDPHQCGCLTCHGFYAATTDPDRAAAMLAAIPRGLLAVRTGAASGLVVIDIDPRHGGRLDPTLMPPTLAVATGHDGWHLYYRHPGHHVTSRPLPGRPGVDVKADGGYVVLPPSVHPDTGRAYRWLPADRPVREMPPALAAAVADPDPRPPATPIPTPTPSPAATRPAPSTGGGGGISSPEALLTAILTTVRTAPQGRRRTTLYGAARGIARMVSAGALTHPAAIAALTDAGRAAQQTDRDIHAAITGGFRDEGLHT